VTEVKLRKDVPFYYFSRGTLDLSTILPLLLTSHSLNVGALATSASQFANQILGVVSHVFRHYIAGGRRVSRAAFSEVGQNFATGAQRFAPHCLGPARQDWADPTEVTAEKIANPVAPLKVERGGVDVTDARSS